MEMHHRLRRDPAWDPRSCNICGQMGHQAAQCSVGTVNWKHMYGARSFILERPIFASEVQAAKKAKQIDFDQLTSKAKDWASGKRPPGPVASTQGPPPPTTAPPPPEAEGLPPGWATAKDAQGKVYFWHRETKKVQWQKPTLEPPPGHGDAETPNGQAADDQEMTATAAPEEDASPEKGDEPENT